MSNPSILILPGDGIGPEVMAEVRKIISWYGGNRGLAFDVSEDWLAARHMTRTARHCMTTQ